ncbi:AAA family ATPase [Kytococcus sedentarius]|uniref:AAA family ATPase n=1 Tax=Kytococcus sedentarius TaxID=1276 RepID=UPI0035BBBFEB
MRIHQVEVQDYRGIDHYRLEVPDSGVLVVEGPNEAGKSTLVKALDMLLAEKASSKKQYVKDCQPIGRDEAPRVTAELTVGGQRFTYTKQWLRSPRTEFRAHGAGGQQLTGDDAHNHVLGLLEEHGDESLRKALQLLQEGPLTVSGLDASQSLAAALDAASGGDSGQAVEQAASLVERVEADAGAFWTSTWRATGELARLRAAHEEAEAEESRARQAVDAIEEDVRRVEELRVAVERAAESAAAAQERREALEQRWEATESERVALAAARESLAQARRDHERAEADNVAREALVKELGEAEEAAQEADRARQAALEPRDLAQQEATGLAARREDAETSEREAREAAAAADQTVVLARAAAEVASLQRAVERLDALRAKLRGVESLLEGDVVDDAALARIISAEDALRSALARRDAANPRVRIAGDAGVPVQVDGEELPAGDRPWESVVGAATLVEVAGVEVHVLPPAGADDSEVEQARRALADALAAVGAQDVADAHRLHAAVQRAAADRTEVEEQLTAVLEGRTLEDWREEHMRAVERVEQAEGEVPSLASAEEAAVAARVALETAREEAETRRTQESAAKELLATRRAELDRAEVQHEGARAAARRVGERVVAAREVAGDEELAVRVGSAAEAVTAAEAVEAQRREALEAVGPVEQDDLESARVAGERAQERHRRARDEHLRAEAMLAQAGQEGRAEDLDAAATRLEHVAVELARVEARAGALRLLVETLRSRRAEAQASYVRPFREALEDLGAVLHGDGFAVDVAPDLSVVSRSVDGRPVPVESLSTGAREQLAVLSRLAVARVIDPDEGMPVVLDDALGWSDPDRLLRMARALERAGAHAQVLVLTCTPGRYDAIAGATVRTVDDLRVTD